MAEEHVGSAVVTGAGRGIGREIALRLGATAPVAVLDLDAAAAEETAELITKNGGQAAAVPVDMCAEDQVRAALRNAVEAVGPVATFVNNAGVLRTGSVLDMSFDQWRTVQATNSDAAFLGMREAARHMVEAGRGGAMIVIASNCARVPRMNHVAYCTSKASTDMLAKVFALELAQHGIRVNAVCPGSVETELQRQQWEALGIGPDKQIRGDLDTYRTGIPLGRLAQPDDIADVVAFLASASARFMIGQSVFVDGGATMF